MQITGKTLLRDLQSGFPRFKIKPDWINPDGSILGHPVINDFARFICDTSHADADEVERALSFLESAVTSKDEYIRDLAWECLETLESCENFDNIHIHFGQNTQALWQTINQSRR